MHKRRMIEVKGDGYIAIKRMVSKAKFFDIACGLCVLYVIVENLYKWIYGERLEVNGWVLMPCLIASFMISSRYANKWAVWWLDQWAKEVNNASGEGNEGQL